MVGLVDKRYIDLSVATQTNEFKELIISSSSELKQAISKLGLIVSNFNIKTSPKVKLMIDLKILVALMWALIRKFDESK